MNWGHMDQVLTAQVNHRGQRRSILHYRCKAVTNVVSQIRLIKWATTYSTQTTSDRPECWTATRCQWRKFAAGKGKNHLLQEIRNI
jgi:hypothetical protein